jgi:hypothetical protein
MSAKAKVSVDMMDLHTLTAYLENEKLHREALMVAAVDPTIAAMKQKLEPHRRASPSAVDSLGSAVAPSRAGFIEILVGAMGFRDYVLWFLNYGTRKQPPRPWLEPSADKVRPGIGERMAAYLRGNK